MNRFVLGNNPRKLHISEYKPEYAGKIFCEDPVCRAPIFLVPGNTMPSHFRIRSPHKHHAKCSAKSNNQKDPRKKKVNVIEGVPVFNLSENIEDIPQNGDLVTKTGRVRQKKSNGVEMINTTRREYLRDISQVGRYISRNFNERYDLPISVGHEEKKLFSIIYDLKRLSDEKNSLNGEQIVVMGQVQTAKITDTGNHFSVYIADENENRTRVYVNNLLVSSIKNKVFIGRCILVRGHYSSDFSGQIVLNKVSDIYIFNKSISVF